MARTLWCEAANQRGDLLREAARPENLHELQASGEGAWLPLRGTAVMGRPSASAEAEVIFRAIEWWRTKQPIANSFEWHIKNPTVNTTSHEEAMLGRAVAAILARPSRPKGPR